MTRDDLKLEAEVFGDRWLEWDDAEDEKRQKKQLLEVLQRVWDEAVLYGK